jgi:electron transfer flavoprotein alpha subunit
MAECKKREYMVLCIDSAAAKNLTASEKAAAADICPFGAIEIAGDGLLITAACRMCRVCVKNGPPGLFWISDETQGIQGGTLDEWRGVAVYAEVSGKRVHPVSLELIGKAKSLGSPVYVLVIGHNLKDAAAELSRYGADGVFVYDNERLADFIIEPYTNLFEDFI